MNNKKLGTQFEQEFCEYLANCGWWVHFISPDMTGSQPFDIIAVKGGKAVAIDCKTCVAKNFSINRLEDNQILAFKRWHKCGNDNTFIAIKHENEVYICDFVRLWEQRIIPIKDMVKARKLM